jgi:hypothetical protein
MVEISETRKIFRPATAGPTDFFPTPPSFLQNFKTPINLPAPSEAPSTPEFWPLEQTTISRYLKRYVTTLSCLPLFVYDDLAKPLN